MGQGVYNGGVNQPKGPFRTKNTTTIAKIVNYYPVVFLLRPPDLLRLVPFSERENVCNSQENGARTRCAAIVNRKVIVQILRVVNLLRVVFLVRQGPLGIHTTILGRKGKKMLRRRGFCRVDQDKNLLLLLEMARASWE